MIGALTWELVRRSDQALLATLDERLPGGKVQVPRHAARSATVELSLDDPASALVETGTTMLRVSVAGWQQPLFQGRVTMPDYTYDGETETLTVNALDPWVQLQRRAVFDTGLFPGAVLHFKSYTNADQSAIIWDLISEVTTHGIVQGSQPGSITRSLSFPAGSLISESVASIANLNGGVDWELEPALGSDGRIAKLNTYYPRQGADLSTSLILRLGTGDSDNIVDFEYEPAMDGMVNRHTVIGDASGTILLDLITQFPLHPAYRAEHAASQATYGIWETVETVSGLTDLSTMEASAKAVVGANAYPIDEVLVTLDPESGPEFGPGKDFWMGDTVTVQTVMPHESLHLHGRIASAEFTEDDDGDVDVVLTCEPQGFSGVTGAATAGVVVDSGEGSVPPTAVTTAVEEISHKKGKKKGKKKKGKKK